ncbi:MAG: hypothetical protein V1859_03585 [archaeon]
MRILPEKNILDEFCEEFVRVTEKHAKYIVVSGFLAISSGRSRSTEDIDMIIERLDSRKFANLHQDLVKNGFICMQSDDSKEIFEYLIDNLSVCYTKTDSPLPEMEVKFAKDPIDEYQLNTRMKIPLTGLDVFFSDININIAFKEHLLKSDKDLKDAEHLRKVYPESVNESEIKRVSKMIDKYRIPK